MSIFKKALALLLVVALIIAAFVVFPEFFTELAQILRDSTQLPTTLPELTL